MNQRLLPWLLPAVVYGCLMAAIITSSGWFSEQTIPAVVILLLVYAAATSVFGPWKCLLLTVAPGLWVVDFALFVDAGAFDCSLYCTSYQKLLQTGLLLATALCLLGLTLGAGRIAQRHLHRRPGEF